MSAPSPTHLVNTMSLVDQIKAELSNAQGALDVDIEELLLVLEEDTDVLELLDRYEELVSSKSDYAARAEARVKQLKKQIAAGRDVMQAILTALGARKLERPTYTASLARGPRSLVLDDANAIPGMYLTMVPDKPEITRALKAGQEVEGARLSDPVDVLRIRRGGASAANEENSNE
jgi:hypothetical protein